MAAWLGDFGESWNHFELDMFRAGLVVRIDYFNSQAEGLAAAGVSQ